MSPSIPLCSSVFEVKRFCLSERRNEIYSRFFFLFFFKEEERKTTPMFPQDVIKLDSLTEVAEREDAHHLVKMQETIIVFGRFRIWLTQLFSSFILSLKLIIFSRQTKKEEDKRRLGVTITTTQPWQDGRLLMLKYIYIYIPSSAVENFSLLLPTV